MQPNLAVSAWYSRVTGGDSTEHRDRLAACLESAVVRELPH